MCTLMAVTVLESFILETYSVLYAIIDSSSSNAHIGTCDQAPVHNKFSVAYLHNKFKLVLLLVQPY